MSNHDNRLDLEEIEAKLSDTTWSALPHTTLSRRIEQVIETIGRNISFVWILLMLLIVANALMRYFFSVNFINIERWIGHYIVSLANQLMWVFIIGDSSFNISV